MTPYSASTLERLASELEAMREPTGGSPHIALLGIRAKLPEIAAALRAAVARVAELEADRANFGEVLAKTNAALNRAGCFSALYFWEHIDAVAAERNSLRTRVAALEALVEEACDIASSWIKTYTPGPSVTADRVAAIRAAAKEAK